MNLEGEGGIKEDQLCPCVRRKVPNLGSRLLKPVAEVQACEENIPSGVTALTQRNENRNVCVHVHNLLPTHP